MELNLTGWLRPREVPGDHFGDSFRKVQLRPPPGQFGKPGCIYILAVDLSFGDTITQVPGLDRFRPGSRGYGGDQFDDLTDRMWFTCARVQRLTPAGTLDHELLDRQI